MDPNQINPDPPPPHPPMDPHQIDPLLRDQNMVPLIDSLEEAISVEALLDRVVTSEEDVLNHHVTSDFDEQCLSNPRDINQFSTSSEPSHLDGSFPINTGMTSTSRDVASTSGVLVHSRDEGVENQTNIQTTLTPLEDPFPGDDISREIADVFSNEEVIDDSNNTQQAPTTTGVASSAGDRQFLSVVDPGVSDAFPTGNAASNEENRVEVVHDQINTQQDLTTAVVAGSDAFPTGNAASNEEIGVDDIHNPNITQQAVNTDLSPDKETIEERSLLYKGREELAAALNWPVSRLDRFSRRHDCTFPWSRKKSKHSSTSSLATSDPGQKYKSRCIYDKPDIKAFELKNLDADSIMVRVSFPALDKRWLLTRFIIGKTTTLKDLIVDMNGRLAAYVTQQNMKIFYEDSFGMFCYLPEEGKMSECLKWGLEQNLVNLVIDQ